MSPVRTRSPAPILLAGRNFRKSSCVASHGSLRCDHVRLVVLVVHFLLAIGSGSAAALPVGVALVGAIPDRGFCGGRRSGTGLGLGHAAGASGAAARVKLA